MTGRRHGARPARPSGDRGDDRAVRCVASVFPAFSQPRRACLASAAGFRGSDDSTGTLKATAAIESSARTACAMRVPLPTATLWCAVGWERGLDPTVIDGLILRPRISAGRTARWPSRSASTGGRLASGGERTQPSATALSGTGAHRALRLGALHPERPARLVVHPGNPRPHASSTLPVYVHLNGLAVWL